MKEADVKKQVKKIIISIDPNADIFMPVQAGYGAADLDFIVGINGYYLAIETKVNGRKPTDRQLRIIAKKQKAGIIVLVIDQHNLDALARVCALLNKGDYRTADFEAHHYCRMYLNQ